MKNIVIVGGGFAGLWAALGAARQIDEHAGDIDVSLISRDRFLTIRPRLYEADPQSLRVPLRATLDPVGVTLIEGDVNEIDHAEHTVTLEHSRGQSETRAYDRLILAAGSTQRPLPIPGFADCSWNIDTYAAAVALDEHLQQVAQHPDSIGNGAIVIIGGGFTGIELATEIRTRIAIHSNAETAAKLRVVLIEQSEVIGPDLGSNPRPEIEQALRAQNVELRTGTRVAEFDKSAVILDDGSRIETTTAIVTAGLAANSLAAQLAVEPDELGRLPVDETLHVCGVPGVLAAGDIARAYVDDAHIALMSCQHAMPMGRYAGYNAARELLDCRCDRIGSPTTSPVSIWALPVPCSPLAGSELSSSQATGRSKKSGPSTPSGFTRRPVAKLPFSRWPTLITLETQTKSTTKATFSEHHRQLPAAVAASALALRSKVYRI